jgi:hypothetical protein
VEERAGRGDALRNVSGGTHGRWKKRLIRAKALSLHAVKSNVAKHADK